MSKEVCFNILHYKTVDYTKKCIDSILNLNNINNSIIIVYDNGSNNGSFEKLEGLYQHNTLVKLIKSNDNAGFTSGMNKAYKMAKEYEPQFIVALNNDTEIWQKDFIKRLFMIDHDEQPFIIGVDIYNPKLKQHQAPLYSHLLSSQEIEKKIEGCHYELEHLDEIVAYLDRLERSQKMRMRTPKFILDLKRSLFNRNEKMLYKEEIINGAVNNGSCIIATKRYINQEDLLLEPDTGFYGEELLLALKCKTLNYKNIYTNKLQITHWGGVATKMEADDAKSNIVKEQNRLIRAYQIYLDTIDHNPWKKG